LDLSVRIGAQTLSAEVATKAIRKAQGTIRVADAFCMLQGKLEGSRINEAGLVAQVKAPKPESASSREAA
jgi:hypothetical protein